MSETPSAPPPAPPRSSSRWRRRLLRAAAGLAALVALFCLWLYWRGGRTVERPLLALLPADTPVAVQIHRLQDLLAAYDASPLADLIATDVEIGALLLSQEEFRAWRDAQAEAELKTHLSLGRDFLLAWAGRELTLAFIPASGEAQHGLVLLTQADLGFRERLAELVAQLYPGARLETADHRGVPITTWRGKKPRNSLSFCRFGETVALSLRTDSRAYLEAIADAALAEDPPEQPVFPPPRAPGLHAWANAERLPAFLASMPSDTVAEWLAGPRGQAARALGAGLEEVRLTYSLDAPRELRLELRLKPGRLPPTPDPDDWTSLARRDALGLVHLREPASWWRQLSPALFDFRFRPDPDWSPERVERRLRRREWRVRLGRWLRDDVLPLLDGPATLVVDSVVPRLGAPAVRAGLVWETSQPAALGTALEGALRHPRETLLAGIEDDFLPGWLKQPSRDRRVGDLTFQTWDTPLGQAGWSLWDSRLLVTLDDAGDPFTRGLLAGWPDALTDHPAHRSVAGRWGDAPRLGEIYLHGLPLTELSPLLLLNREMWTESGRRTLEQIRLANHLLALYPAVGLALQRGRDSLSLVLAVAASGEGTSVPQ